MTSTTDSTAQDTPANGTTPEPPAPTNVIQALARIMVELPGIGRHEKSEQGYQYRGIEAITSEAQHLLGKYGVVFVPKVIHREVKEFPINNRPWTEDHATIVYTVYGPGGVADRIEVGPLIGLGRDNSDKGMNKAMTQAFKYALLQTLCIGDAKDDPDSEKAHERDEVAHDADPETLARREYAGRVRALSPEDRARVRDYGDAHDVPRVPSQLSDEQLERMVEFVDGIEVATAQDRAAEATDSPPGEPAAQDGTDTPPATSEAQEGTQDAPGEAFTIAEMVAAMPIRQVLEELDDRKDRLPAALPGSPKAQRALLQVVLEAEAAKEAPIGDTPEG